PRSGPSHIVAVGQAASIIAPRVLYRSDRFPLWAIAGQGLITGWTGGRFAEPFPALRLDPVRLAATEPKTPAPIAYPDPPPVSAWERYRVAPKPAAAASHEAALWLVAREAVRARANPAASAAQIAASIGRAVPAGPSDLANRLCDPLVIGQFVQGLAEPAWQHGPDGQFVRVAPLLAIRAARRAIL